MINRDARAMIDRYRANPPRHRPGNTIPCYDSPVEPGVWNVRADHECDALRITSPGGESSMVALFLDERQTPRSRDFLAYQIQTTLRVLSQPATEELAA